MPSKGTAALALCLLLACAAGAHAKARSAEDTDDFIRGVVGDDDEGLVDMDGEDFVDGGDGGLYAEEGMRMNADALEDEKRFFSEHDKDGDGFLTFEEYMGAIEAVNEGDDEAEEKYEPDVDAMKQDFADEDADKDKRLSLDEWLLATFHENPQGPDYDDEGLEELTEEEKAQHRQMAVEEFAKFDINGDKKLTYQELLDFVKAEEAEEARLHPEDPPVEGDLAESVKEMFEEMDLDKSSDITLPEFLEIQYDIRPEGTDPA
mmetsp:Transcript_32202/g.78993  ORF Transcript_32202/g.78993 Transcript_32202/m.78993 type:complete len:262 (-) Transcript_32202:324-1109(-)